MRYISAQENTPGPVCECCFLRIRGNKKLRKMFVEADLVSFIRRNQSMSLGYVDRMPPLGKLLKETEGELSLRIEKNRMKLFEETPGPWGAECQRVSELFYA